MRGTLNDIRLKCRFCHSEISLVECHGHHHCVNCGMPNFECCDGETASPPVEEKVEDNWPKLRYMENESRRDPDILSGADKG